MIIESIISIRLLCSECGEELKSCNQKFPIEGVSEIEVKPCKCIKKE